MLVNPGGLVNNETYESKGEMHMNTTITLGEAGLLLLGAAFLVLIIYTIVLVRHLVATVKATNQVMADVQIITGIAAEGSQEAVKVITEFSQSAGTVSNLFKANQSTISALTNLVNSLAALRNLFTKSKKA